MSDEYQPFEQLMKSKREGHTRPEGDFAEFLKAKGKMGVPSLDPLENRSMTSGTASPNTPSLEPVALDATPQGKPTGSARSAAGAEPCHGPDTGEVSKADWARKDSSDPDSLNRAKNPSEAVQSHLAEVNETEGCEEAEKESQHLKAKLGAKHGTGPALD